MKTKHWFFRYAAAVIALALVLTGCNKDNIQVKTGYSNLRFVVNAGEKPGVAEGGDTRALKTGWADGDRIGVLFDIAGTHYALLEYADAAGTWTRLESSLPAELAAAGEVIALHAGNEGFGYSNTGNFTGIGGDLLYDGAGTYAYDSGTQTITLTLSMQRGLTTAIKMESTGTLEDNMKWRLAGPGVSVLTGNTFTPADYADFTFDTALPGLFSVSDAESGTGAVPDPAFTDNDMVVFHVLRSGEEAGETTLQLWNTDNPTTLYTRTYDNNLTAGGSVMLAGPTVDAEADEWAETTIEPSDNGITLWANDTGIPLDFTAAGNWTVTVTEGLTSSGSEAYWIELLAPEGYP
ncbi:MAG: hypothetical protein LBV47_01615, partial [Bacteroidales bacterium]|nr:hypothetical protein [Bacteroidales bacterium]